MALLHSLLNVQKSRPGLEISAAHFNHRLRDEAEEEQAFVRGFCEEHGVPAYFDSADVGAYAKAHKMGVEQAARELRYAFLYGAAQRCGAEYIALAHHMDDQAETLLLHLLRGCGLQGLCGMQELSGMLYRPLLGVSKAEILRYCEQNALPYRNDLSNECTDYTRNRIRALMRELEKSNINFSKGCARTALLLRQDRDCLDDIAERAFAQGFEPGKGLALCALDCPPAIFARLVMRLAKEAGLDKDVEQKHIAAIGDLCLLQSGRGVDLPRGYRARVSFDRLMLEKTQNAGESAFGAAAESPLEGEGSFELGGYCVRWKKVDKMAVAVDVLHADAAKLEGCVLRARREGDRITPLGMRGSKSLKDYFCDRKVDRSRRGMPLIARGSEVLVVPGGGISEKVKVTPETAQILEIIIYKAGECASVQY